jgi:hypothetical protein
VAVTSNSHKEIDNLLLAVAERARETKFRLKAIKKISNGDAPDDPAIEATTANDEAS